MAKRKLRAWTKKDVAELKGAFKIQNAGLKDFESDETNGCGALRQKARIVGVRLGHRR